MIAPMSLRQQHDVAEGGKRQEEGKIELFLQELKMRTFKTYFKLPLVLNSIVVQFVALLKQITFSNSQQCAQSHW